MYLINATSFRDDKEQYIYMYVRINVKWFQMVIENMITTGTCGSKEEYNQSIYDGIRHSPLNFVGI